MVVACHVVRVGNDAFATATVDDSCPVVCLSNWPGLQFQTLGSVSDQLLEVFDFGFAEIGSLVGAFFLSGLVFGVPAGFVGRYATDKTLVATGLAALAVGGALAAIATGFGCLRQPG
ncbi:MAG: hypothetical protein CM1200mP41_27310 [Gammaproteobacteria bacterium]|nr:MAG: hypothetical protein CM1200mP41_27310 [Gammaproteobacteria bacterium]